MIIETRKERLLKILRKKNVLIRMIDRVRSMSTVETGCKMSGCNL